MRLALKLSSALSFFERTTILTVETPQDSLKFRKISGPISTLRTKVHKRRLLHHANMMLKCQMIRIDKGLYNGLRICYLIVRGYLVLPWDYTCSQSMRLIVVTLC